MMFKFNQYLNFCFRNLIFIFYPLLFFAIGSFWAFSSPISSSADDDFHLTSIWCAQGPSEKCLFLVDGTVKVPSELNTNLIPPKYSSWPPCYVDWFMPTKSAKCLNQKEEQMSLTDRVGIGYYPQIYYLFHSVFVGKDVSTSIYTMRIMNVIIGAIILGLLIYVSERVVRRAVILTWGITTFPISIFFIASNNPSSWSIIGIGTFWGFLLNFFIQFFKKSGINHLNIIGLIFSLVLAIGSRNDSLIYILIILFSTCIIYAKEIIKIQLKHKPIFIILLLISFFTMIIKFLNEISGFSFGIPKENMELNRPNALVNLLIELPSYVISLFGGQQPYWVQNKGGLGRDFAYGAGWLDFSFPSITGIFIGSIVFYFLLSGLGAKYKLKNFGFIFILLSVISIVVITRAKWNFVEADYFQPRYLLPIFIFLIGIALLNFESVEPLKSHYQLVVISLLFTLGSSISWLATFSRYINEGSVPFTNFRVIYDWWNLPIIFSKFDLFIIYVLMQSLWTFFYIVIPNKVNVYQSVFKNNSKHPNKLVKV